MPVTVLTCIDAEPLAGDPAAWLRRLREGGEALEGRIEAGMAAARAVAGAYRVAAADPAVAEPALARALAVRVGYGSGEELAEGRWTDALLVPEAQRRRGRIDALRPQERFAALLGGRERPHIAEELVLRSRADLDAARYELAALGARAAAEALLAQREELGPSQAGDLEALAAALEQRDQSSGSAEQRAAAAIELCERILRRRAATR